MFREWLKTCVGMNRVSRHMRYLDKRISRLEKEKNKSEQAIEKHRDNIDEMQSRLERELDATRQSLDDAYQNQKRLEEALRSAQEELKTANEIVIPGLVAANKTLIDRWDAESATYAMRVVAAQGGRGSE